MITRVSQATPNISIKGTAYSTFSSPLVSQDENNLQEIEEQNHKSFEPKGLVFREHTISKKEIFPNPLKMIGDLFGEDWAQKIINNKNLETIYRNFLSGLGLVGTQVDYVIKSGIDNIVRVKDWANTNIKLGKEGANFALGSIIVGVGKTLLEPLIHSVKWIMKPLDVVHGFLLALRGKNQYSIHARLDDEFGINCFQKEHCGNFVSAFLGKIACFFEKYVNPVLLPVVSFFLSGTKRNAAILLSMIPRLGWWSGRYPAYFDQRFMTYLFKYPFHKLLSLFGNEESKKVINEINESKVLNLGYLKERLKTHFGLKEGESVIKKAKEYIKGLFSKDIDEVDKSAKHMSHTLAAPVGVLGSFFTFVGIPLKAGLDLAGKDTGKFIDVFSTLRFFIQPWLYFFRFSMPEYVDSERLFKDSKNPCNMHNAEHIKMLAVEKRKLFYSGAFSNVVGILLPFTRLLRDDHWLSRLIKSVSGELSNDAVSYFLSKRRELKGKQAILNLGEEEKDTKTN